MAAQKPLELILARNLLSSISTPYHQSFRICAEVKLSDGSILILRRELEIMSAPAPAVSAS